MVLCWGQVHFWAVPDDMWCFVGESWNADAMCPLCYWDGETPYFYFFKHGVDEEKVVSIWTRLTPVNILYFDMSRRAYSCEFSVFIQIVL